MTRSSGQALETATTTETGTPAYAALEVTGLRPTPQSEDDADYGSQILMGTPAKIPKHPNKDPVVGGVTEIEVGRRKILDQFCLDGDADRLVENMAETAVAIVPTPKIDQNTPVETP